MDVIWTAHASNRPVLYLRKIAVGIQSFFCFIRLFYSFIAGVLCTILIVFWSVPVRLHSSLFTLIFFLMAGRVCSINLECQGVN